ncbi:MAG TPA: hypothetical protein VGO40_16480 [Longimicrobium sp.]|jgi:hypothetical protein|nr:hypothetical protein [Longimicrobium sp.]
MPACTIHLDKADVDAFLELADAERGETGGDLVLERRGPYRSGGLAPSGAEIAAVVSTATAVVELAKLLYGWLRPRSTGTVTVEYQAAGRKVTITRTMSVQEIQALLEPGPPPDR